MNINDVLNQAESGITKAQQFLADLTQARSELQNAPHNLYSQITETVSSTRRDVARAAALQQMLPVAVAAVGIIAGQPVLGIAAAGALYATGKKAGAA